MGVSLAFIIWDAHALEEVYSLEVTGGGPHRQKIVLVVMRLPGIPVAPPLPPLPENIIANKADKFKLWTHELGYVTDGSYSSYCYKNIGRGEMFYEKSNSIIDTIFMRNLMKYSGVLSLTDNQLAYFRLGPAQDVHFFYTRSHFSALQNCT